MLSRNRNYTAYADIYDAFKGNRLSFAQFIENLITRRRPQAHSILDLACGTGSLEQGLAGRFDFVGLDSSPRMLKLARQKVPNVRFIESDMASFKLNDRFDVATCLHNSVNHLQSFAHWQQAFRTAASHLHTSGHEYVVTQVFTEAASGAYTWDVKVLLKKKDGYIVRQERIPIQTYPLNMITTALHTVFSSVELLEPIDPAIPDDVGKIYFICTV